MPIAMTGSNRRTIRGEINPLDRATIVSIFPKEIEETKPTIQPGIFKINAGSYESPAILTVGPSSWWRDVDPDQPLLEIPISSIQIADSIVKDYCAALLAVDMGSAQPGIFYVPGEKTLIQIKKEFSQELEKAQVRQRAWYSNLIKMADSLWARSNGNPLAIGDDMRLAAKEMGQGSTKDWMKDHQMVDMTRCKACGSLRNPLYPVCPTCKAIDDPARAKELGIAFAS